MWKVTIRSKGIDTRRIEIISPNSGSTTEATFTSVVPEGASFVFMGLGPHPHIDGSIVAVLREIGIPRIDETAEVSRDARL